ncbi:MAG: hypothetical protein COB37_10735 [Kordiimonadales bacterium]|nr:MAG: hypothetical protein COB37_10735 [Kordiimonadales bacterium]
MPGGFTLLFAVIAAGVVVVATLFFIKKEHERSKKAAIAREVVSALIGYVNFLSRVAECFENPKFEFPEMPSLDYIETNRVKLGEFGSMGHTVLELHDSIKGLGQNMKQVHAMFLTSPDNQDYMTWTETHDTAWREALELQEEFETVYLN